MMLEATIFFDSGLAEDFVYRRMRGGQLLSKGRYLGAQMLAYLEDDLWIENAPLRQWPGAEAEGWIAQNQPGPNSLSGPGQRDLRRHAARAE